MTFEKGLHLQLGLETSLLQGGTTEREKQDFLFVFFADYSTYNCKQNNNSQKYMCAQWQEAQKNCYQVKMLPDLNAVNKYQVNNC